MLGVVLAYQRCCDFVDLYGVADMAHKLTKPTLVFPMPRVHNMILGYINVYFPAESQLYFWRKRRTNNSCSRV